MSVDLPVSFQWRAEEEREETGSVSEAKAKRKYGMFVCERQRKIERNTHAHTQGDNSRDSGRRMGELFMRDRGRGTSSSSKRFGLI